MFYVSLKKRESERKDQDRVPLDYIDGYYARKAPHQPDEWWDSRVHIYALGPDARIVQTENHIFVLNGYFSNFSELRGQGDVEIKNEEELLKHLFYSEGLSGLKVLKGSFSVVLYDRREHTVQVVSDFYGFRPTYYTETPNFFLFCSRHQPLARHEEFDHSLNEEAICDYFTLGLCLAGKTFFSRLKMSAENTHVFIEDGKLVEQPFGLTDSRCDFSRANLPEAAEEIFRRVKKSTGFLINRFGIESAYLTGGSDTRVMLACLSREELQGLQFLTYRAPTWSPDDWDATIAIQLAKHYGLRHELIDFEESPVPLPMGGEALRPLRARLPVLTASFGTELLGQGVFLSLPFQYSLFNYQKYTKFKKWVFSPEFVKTKYCPYSQATFAIDSAQAPSKEYAAMARYLWRSYFSLTYSPYGTSVYIAPYENQYKNKFSPFLTQDVLDAIMGLPREYLVNYRVYEHLFSTDLIGGSELPLNSTMVRHARGVTPVEKKPAPHVKSKFDYRKAIAEAKDSPVFKLPIFDKDFYKIVSDTGWADLVVKTVDFLYWYRHCVQNKSFYDEEIHRD